VRKLRYHVASTLDGFIAHPDGSFGGFLAEGDHVADFLASYTSYDTVLMGRKTYEVGLAVGVTDPYPTMKPYVFSRTLERSPDPRVEIVREGAGDRVRKLKKEPGKDIWLCGGAELAGALFDERLVDEVVIKLNPRIFGSGIPLVSGGERRLALELRDTKVYDSGVVLLTYGVAAR
jgi:dihydrofolate reductase